MVGEPLKRDEEIEIEGGGEEVEVVTGSSAWIAKKESERAAAAEQPAAPTPSAWRDQTITDAPEYEFFAGKKVGDLYNSYLHLNRLHQQESQRYAQLERENDQLRREREAVDAVQRIYPFPQQQQATPPEAQPAEDPRWQTVREKWFTDEVEATRVMREILRDEWRAEQEQVVDERWQAIQEAQADHTNQQHSVLAGAQAADYIAQAYGISPQEAEGRVIYAMWQYANSGADWNPSIWADPNTYLWAVGQVYGAPQAPTAQAEPEPQHAAPPPPAIRQQAEPPGSKRPAPASARASEPRARFSGPEVATMRQFARAGGVDPQKFEERRRRNAANRGAANAQ